MTSTKSYSDGCGLWNVPVLISCVDSREMGGLTVGYKVVYTVVSECSHVDSWPAADAVGR